MKKIFMIALLVVLGVTTSCSLDPDLADKAEVGISDGEVLVDYVNGAYHDMKIRHYWGRNMQVYGEVRADNVYSNGSSGRFVTQSRMSTLSTNARVANTFEAIYGTVAYANIIIHADLDNLEGKEADIQHILGEAYLIRALTHFDLLRLFGQQYIDAGENLGISYIKNYKADDIQIPRGTVQENLTDIYTDIQQSIAHFEQGAASTRASQKTNLTLYAAYALESRAGIYFKDYAKVLEHADAIIGAFPITPEADFVQYWEQQTPPPASIFELANNSTDKTDGMSNIYRGDSFGDLVVYDDLIQDAEFDANDVRASSAMIDFDQKGVLRNMGKYPSMGSHLGEDNAKVFRYEEVVLNVAEALLETGDAAGSLDLLNQLTTQRGAQPYTSATLDNIVKERRKELLFEGFRFFDLQRMGKDIPEVDPTKPNNHGLVKSGSSNMTLPIPQKEIDQNKQSQQNPDY